MSGQEGLRPVVKMTGTPKSVICVVFFIGLVIVAALVGIAMHIYTLGKISLMIEIGREGERKK